MHANNLRIARFIGVGLCVTVGFVFVQSLRAADQASAKSTAAPTDLPLLLDENFANGADRWQPASPEAWKMIDLEGGGKAFSSFKVTDLTKKLPHRSPWDVALLKDITVANFVLEVKMRETAREYPHRDACLLFGYQDPSHFYYVHFAPVTGDPHADQVFIVNNADRAAITDKDHLSTGVKWGDKTTWHRLKIVRNIDSGLIEAYFHEDDAPFTDADKPLMTAHDKTFTSGRIGVGTFDDTSDIAEVKLWGNKVKSPGPDVSYP
ncbi:MAG TPA: hypothetical protein VFE46_06070 [Pirellulales bacterium]|nr:hypothetical protein [Pirellulales bacterium]